MEAYLKKLCFEYQVEEREVTELLARMEWCIWIKARRLLLLQCPSRACILSFPVSCIHFPVIRERTGLFASCRQGMRYCVTTQENIP